MKILSSFFTLLLCLAGVIGCFHNPNPSSTSKELFKSAELICQPSLTISKNNVDSSNFIVLKIVMQPNDTLKINTNNTSICNCYLLGSDSKFIDTIVFLPKIDSINQRLTFSHVNKKITTLKINMNYFSDSSLAVYLRADTNYQVVKFEKKNYLYIFSEQ